MSAIGLPARFASLPLVLALSLPGCSNSSSPRADSDSGAVGPGDGGAVDAASPSLSDGAADGADAGLAGDGTVATDAAPGGPLLQDGLWFASLGIASLNGLQLDFQVEIASEVHGDGSGLLRRFALRAVGAADGAVSPVLQELHDLPVDAQGNFVAEFQPLVIPGAYTVTRSDLLVRLVFSGTVRSPVFLCGSLAGGVLNVLADLNGSGFAAVPWGSQSQPPLDACEPSSAPPLQHIEQCPALQAGWNRDFPSAGVQYSFKLFLPSGEPPAVGWPVIFLYHGLPSSADEILDQSQLDHQVDVQHFVLVVPESRKTGTFWDFALEQESPDEFLFDDILTCLAQQFPVDLESVHATGHSAGGLWTGRLSFRRADVLASVAPLSGGILVSHPPTDRKLPALVVWGGPTDKSHGQDFDLLAQSLIAAYHANGQFVVACNHGQGHAWLPEFSPWVAQFLLDHPQSLEDEPYADGLPAQFPGYCEIVPP